MIPTGYDVYVQYCGQKFTDKSLNQVKSGSKTAISIKKVNGKKFNLNTVNLNKVIF